MKKTIFLFLSLFSINSYAETNKDVSRNYDVFDFKNVSDCYQGEDKSCQAIGSVFGNENIKTYEVLLTQAKEACDLNNPYACYFVGNDIHKNDDEKKAFGYYEKAFVNFQKQCDLKDPNACFWLGMMYQKGLGTQKDEEKELESFEKGCYLGDALICQNTADLYANWTLDVSDQKAFELYLEACKLNSAESCVSAGCVLSQLDKKYMKNENEYEDEYENEDETINEEENESNQSSKSGGKLVALLEKGCTLGIAESCYVLGSRYDKGAIIEKNEQKALEYYAKALPLYEKQCNLYNDESCYKAGKMYMEREYSTENRRKAFALYAKAFEFYVLECDLLKFSESCVMVGDMYLV